MAFPAEPPQPQGQPRTRRLAHRPLTEPHPDRLSPSHPAYEAVLAAHRSALETGQDSYVDPSSGLTVFTADYLARRGTCCDTGCRHCPYVE